MKSKKIMMIALLVIFLIIIGAIIVKINNKSSQKLDEIAEATDNTNVSNENTTNLSSTASGIIRKNTETVKADTSNMIEITDNYFIQQTNDVYFNLDEYIGKTIKMEGIIYTYEDTNGDVCYAVVRNTPGCCGDDGLAGLDIRYDGEYPEENTWVEVVGVMGTDTVYGSEIPAIQVVSLVETETGTTFVSN